MELDSTNIAVPYNSPTESIITVEHFNSDGDIPLDSGLILDDFEFMRDNDLPNLDTSPPQNVSDVIHQLHGGHEEQFSLGNNRNDNSPPYQNGYTSDGSYQTYPQKNPQVIENYSNGDFQQQKQKYALSPQDQSFPQYKQRRCHIQDSPRDSGSEPCSSPPENRDFIDSNRYINNGNLGQEQLQRHRLSHQQHNHLHTLPGGSSPSGESTCSHHSGGSSSGSSYTHNLNHNHQQLSPPDNQVQIQQQEFENTLDSVRTSVANSRNVLHQQSMDHNLGNSQSFHGNMNYADPQPQSGTSFYVGQGDSVANPTAASDIHSPGSNGLPHTGQQHINPLMEQFLSSQINPPSAKKRRHSESPQGIPAELSATQLNQQYQQMLAMQTIKQEPGLTSPTGCSARGYYNDAYEMGDSTISRHHVTIQRGMIGGSTHSINSAVQMPGPGMGSSMLQHGNGLQRQNSTVSPTGPSTHYMENSSYQVIKWSPHQRETWCQLLDGDGKELPTVSYRVDADKGFNFAVPDDTFVCQKKNHFQVTVHIGVDGHPAYVKTEEGLKEIDAFYLNLYGIKYESMSQTISIEQSQSDRSKKSFHPVKVDLPGNQVTKVTVGRLHFSETTSNNMRKKGRPNPDQRYFMCVVALQALAQGKHYMVCSSRTEKIIVRASNPGQFDSDAVPWQSGTGQDTIFHHGKVGINCDKPDESLVVHGNLKVTGRVMQPSDMRAKENIEEVDTKDQLKNVQNIRIVRYNYSPEYCEAAGIDPSTVTTGVLAQEFQKVMPNAVKDTGDVQLNTGQTIPHFLVVDKDQLFMENVGAVKELCNLTSKFESRIDQLEKWNKKLAKLKKYDSIRSNVSMFSGISSLSTSTGTPSVSRMGSARFAKNNNQNKGKTKRKSSQDSGSNHRHRDSRGDAPQENGGIGCLNQKFTSGLVIALFLVMLFSFVAMSTLYAISLNNNGDSGCTGSKCALRGAKNGTGVDSSTHLRSTTDPSSVTESHSAPSRTPLDPIRYCPENRQSQCETTNYCCAVDTPGQEITTTCLRGLHVTDVMVHPKPRTFSSPWKTKLPPTRNYEPPVRHNYGDQPYSFPNHRSKTERQWRQHHARGSHKHTQTPHPTIMDYPQRKEPASSTSRMTHAVTTTMKPLVHTSPKFPPLFNATEKKALLKKSEKENLEPSAFDTDKAVDPPNPGPGHNVEDGIDNVHHDEIDSNPLKAREVLPASEVRKRAKRVASSSEGDSPATGNFMADRNLSMASIRLVEPNVILYENVTESKYLLCESPGNFSFNVPVSMHTPPGVPITIEFNTTVPGYVYLCTHSKRSFCPEIREYQPGENLDGRFRGGSTHRFKLLFSSYISSDYWFRLTTEDKAANCKSPVEEHGHTFHLFRFRFYRPCTIETPPDSDAAPAGETNPANAYQEMFDYPMTGDHNETEEFNENTGSTQLPGVEDDMAHDQFDPDEDSNLPSHGDDYPSDEGFEM